jgi:hypothetical protein
MIVGLIFIIISAPIWLGLTFFYLSAMGLFYLALTGLEIFISIIKVVNEGFDFGEAMTSVLGGVIESFFKWFVRIDDIYELFWEFGRYTHQGWAIAISIFLFLIYISSSNR